MLNIEDGLNIELISGKIVENIVKKGIKYYHLCYEVENIEEKLQRMGNDIKPISEIKEAILFDGRKVIFVIASYGLIELVENKKNILE
jgi:methylmalonyl-CoA/ethylmalonyl-CoA epimerase